LKIALQILDPRLSDWGFPSYGSALAAGLDLFACLEAPLALAPQAPAALVSAGIAVRIGDGEWCGLVLPRSGLGHRQGLVLGNTVGLIDADYEGPILISAWNRNPPGESRDRGEEAIVIRPGDRIAQLVFTRIMRPQFEVVSAIAPQGGRGTGGFGSTGVEAACRRRAPRRNLRQRHP
jgi:dUTP pyrophosphatase